MSWLSGANSSSNNNSNGVIAVGTDYFSETADHYEVLGFEDRENITDDMVKRAYQGRSDLLRRQVQANPSDSRAARAFDMVLKAYQGLKDKDSRDRYNCYLQQQERQRKQSKYGSTSAKHSSFGSTSSGSPPPAYPQPQFQSQTHLQPQSQMNDFFSGQQQYQPHQPQVQNQTDVFDIFGLDAAFGTDTSSQVQQQQQQQQVQQQQQKQYQSSSQWQPQQPQVQNSNAPPSWLSKSGSPSGSGRSAPPPSWLSQPKPQQQQQQQPQPSYIQRQTFGSGYPATSGTMTNAPPAMATGNGNGTGGVLPGIMTTSGLLFKNAVSGAQFVASVASTMSQQL